jgi:hypothetical protein
LRYPRRIGRPIPIILNRLGGYQHDADRRLTQAEQTLSGTVNERADCTYFDNGSLHTITQPADNGITTIAVNTWGMTSDARLTTLNHTEGGTTLDGHTFSQSTAGTTNSRWNYGR